MKRAALCMMLIGLVMTGFSSRISGNVTRRMDLFPFPMPAEGVTVRLESSADPEIFAEDVTDSDGNFTVVMSSTGIFQLSCPSELTTPPLYSVTFSTGTEVVTGYDFEISSGSATEGALIGGKVSYEDGAPAADVSVIIMRPDAGIPLPIMATTDAVGEYSASIDGDESIEITCMPVMYTAVPEMYSDYIAVGDTIMSYDFVLTDDSPMDYTITFQGTVGGMTTDFTAFYRHSSDSVEHSLPISMDSAPIAVPDTGDYYCRAEKPGYRSDPPTTTVHIGRMMPMGMAVFTFTDTSETPDYSIVCRAVDGFMPIMDYNVRWRPEGSSSWATESPSMMGSVEILPDGPGTYEMIAIAPGYTLYPDTAVVELTDLSPRDSVVFSTDDDDTTTSDNWFTVLIQDEEGYGVEGIEVSFASTYDSTSGTLTTDADGYATHYVAMLGNFLVTPRPSTGFWTVPEDQSVLISPLTPVDTLIFELREGEPFYYSVTVSAIDDSDDLVTSTYVIQYNSDDDTVWSTEMSDGSGYTTIEFEDPGMYNFQALTIGSTVEPEMLTSMLTVGDPVDSIQFRFIDSTGTEDPFILVLRSVTPEGEPFPDLSVAWDRSFSEDSGVVSTGSTGEISLEFDDMGYYNFVSRPGSGYFTVPEEVSALLSTATPSDTVEFVVYEGTPGTYRITVAARDEEDSLVSGYRINWRQPADDSTWSMLWSDGSGYTDIEFDFPGDFQIRADMYGLMFEPDTAFVSLTEGMPIDTVWFNVTDTSDTSEEYSITVISIDEDEFPYPDLQFIVESAMDSTVDTLTTGFSGEITQYFSRSDYYTIRAIVPEDHYVEPLEESILLSFISRADTVIFTVGTGEPPLYYWITIFSTDSSETPQFGTSMDIDEETAMTNFEGYASLFVDGPGTYAVSAYVSEIPGFDFVVVPDEFYVTLSEDHPADTTHVWVTNVEAVLETPELPNDFSLTAYPNPFNGSCFIDAPADADVAIFNTDGREVARGHGSFNWVPADLPSGVYSVVARKANNEISRNLLYLK